MVKTACMTRVGSDSFDITNLRKVEEDKKKSGLFNHGLTLVKGARQAAQGAQPLFKHFQPDHFDPRIAHLEYFEFIIADDDTVF